MRRPPVTWPRRRTAVAPHPMRERQRATVAELRRAIDCLPRDTRIAMLEGIQRNEIVVGAYTHEDGICPMLAAHRHGGRTSRDLVRPRLGPDGVPPAERTGPARRRATERELLILRTHLEASLLADEGPAPRPGRGDRRAPRATARGRRPSPAPEPPRRRNASAAARRSRPQPRARHPPRLGLDARRCAGSTTTSARWTPALPGGRRPSASADAGRASSAAGPPASERSPSGAPRRSSSCGISCSCSP